jgi:hypothetical protein
MTRVLSFPRTPSPAKSSTKRRRRRRPQRVVADNDSTSDSLDETAENALLAKELIIFYKAEGDHNAFFDLIGGQKNRPMKRPASAPARARSSTEMLYSNNVEAHVEMRMHRCSKKKIAGSLLRAYGWVPPRWEQFATNPSLAPPRSQNEIRDANKQQLIAFYRRHAPSKATNAHVDDLLRKFSPAEIQSGETSQVSSKTIFFTHGLLKKTIFFTHRSPQKVREHCSARFGKHDSRAIGHRPTRRGRRSECCTAPSR